MRQPTVTLGLTGGGSKALLAESGAQLLTEAGSPIMSELLSGTVALDLLSGAVALTFAAPSLTLELRRNA